MKSYIELDGELYEMKDIPNLSVREYDDFIEETKKELIEEELMKKILKTLTTLEDWQLDSIQLISLLEIDWSAIMSAELKKDIRLNRKYGLNGTKYTLHDFERLPFGKWIDIDDIITNDPENMTFLLAVMLSDNDYDISSIKKLEEIIKDHMSIQDAYSIWWAFISWRASIFKQFAPLFISTTTEEDEEEPDYFDEEDNEEDEDEFKGNQWMEIAYSLTNEDITKKDEILEKGILEILNWLAYLKDKREQEKEDMKKSETRIH